MLEQFKSEIAKRIQEVCSLDYEQIYSLLEKPKNREHGDFAFPCFSIAKQEKKNPKDCATHVVESINLPKDMASINQLGPFINFALNREKVSKLVIEEILEKKEKFGTTEVNKNVVIEYSSPNIAKPFHVGHLRPTLLGSCLDKVYRHRGWNVDSVNHLGDWGTQFGFVWAGCKLWGKPENPSVHELVELYRKATSLKKEQGQEGEVNNIARQYFIDLEKGDKTAVEFWQWCLEISLKYLKQTYKRLDVHFDHYLGESFYAPMLEDLKKDLEDKNLLVNSEGAFGVDLSEQDLGFARITTNDSRSLYLARDISAAEYRYEKFKYDLAVYVVGAPQKLHFQQLKEVLKQKGKDYNIEHVAFGHVLGMSTRGKGEFIELNSFVDQGYEKALKAYREQVKSEAKNEEEIASAVSKAAITFSTLSKTRIKDVQFSWDEALAFQGDSGPYILYAFARINSIRNKVEIELPKEVKGADLIEDSAYNLVMHLSQFESCLDKTIEGNDPSFLCTYSLDLAKLFSKAYRELKVVGDEKAASRLALFEATAVVIKICLKLLGVKTIDKM